MKVTTRRGEEYEFDKLDEFTVLGVMLKENGHKTKN